MRGLCENKLKNLANKGINLRSLCIPSKVMHEVSIDARSAGNAQAGGSDTPTVLGRASGIIGIVLFGSFGGLDA